MDVFLLGAGRPALGQKPSALKSVARNTTAMDWQIHSFEPVAPIVNIHFLGGYHVDEVIKTYPNLNFTVVPDWKNKNVLHTLLKAPFKGNPAFASYSDTVFRKEVVLGMQAVEADVVYCVDTCWKERYEQRDSDDISSAETIAVKNENGVSEAIEFTGLIYFKNAAVEKIATLKEADVGTNLVDLLSFLENSGLSVKPFDAAGDWAELNSPADIARFILGTKAETLARLEPLVQCSHIGRQICFTSSRWRDEKKQY